MLLVFLLLAVALLHYIAKFYYNVWCRPKGPLPLPLVGNLHQLDRSAPYKTLLVWAKRYGPVFSVYLPQHTVVLSDLETIREATVNHGW